MDHSVTTAQQLSVHLRSLRQARHWSQAQLGQKLGIGQARIAKIEADPASVSVEQLLAMLAALGCQMLLRATSGDEPAQPQARIPASNTEW